MCVCVCVCVCVCDEYISNICETELLYTTKQRSLKSYHLYFKNQYTIAKFVCKIGMYRLSLSV